MRPIFRLLVLPTFGVLFLIALTAVMADNVEAANTGATTGVTLTINSPPTTSKVVPIIDVAALIPLVAVVDSELCDSQTGTQQLLVPLSVRVVSTATFTGSATTTFMWSNFVDVTTLASGLHWLRADRGATIWDATTQAAGGISYAVQGANTGSVVLDVVNGQSGASLSSHRWLVTFREHRAGASTNLDQALGSTQFEGTAVSASVDSVLFSKVTSRVRDGTTNFDSVTGGAATIALRNPGTDHVSGLVIVTPQPADPARWTQSLATARQAAITATLPFYRLNLMAVQPNNPGPNPPAQMWPIGDSDDKNAVLWRLAFGLTLSLAASAAIGFATRGVRRVRK